jgi:hypothetical protein
MFASDIYFRQTLNEIRICAQIGYHANICTMLGYVSSERITCLLLELADTNLHAELATIRHQLVIEKTRKIDQVVEYLTKTAIQIASGMVVIFNFFCCK